MDPTSATRGCRSELSVFPRATDSDPRSSPCWIEASSWFRHLAALDACPLSYASSRQAIAEMSDDASLALTEPSTRPFWRLIRNLPALPPGPAGAASCGDSAATGEDAEGGAVEAVVG
jgi:hypothetical protein